MKKYKCPNCGYEYDDNLAICPICSNRLDKVQDDLSTTKDEMLNQMDEFTSTADKDFQNYSKRKIVPFGDNVIVNFLLILIFLSLALWCSVYLIIQKQQDAKAELQYKNYISQPEKIPLLKDPTSYNDLKTNLLSVEKFLSYYLKFSNDAPNTKEQIFISFLKEMDKLPNITTENFINSPDYCASVGLSSSPRSCTNKLSKEYKDIGVLAYSNYNTMYLYPDYRFIEKKYSKYLSSNLKKYLKLRAKYYKPTSVGLDLYIKPSSLADKIYKFELLYNIVLDSYIREEILRMIYNDFHAFIFSPVIYSTTTHEMKPEFRSAYLKFISSRRKSQLRPLVMSYLDKQKNYTEENFKNDYPYEIEEEKPLDEDASKYLLQDVFLSLRETIFNENNEVEHDFKFVYNIVTSKWSKYNSNKNLEQGEYAFGAIGQNNSIPVYDSKFEFIQELNVPKYTKFYLLNGVLIAYNTDKLQLSRLIFNGRNFVLQTMNTSDITSFLPGINVVYIDSYQSYTIDIRKANQKAYYIILSRYMQGFKNYKFETVEGKTISTILPNIFGVDSNEPVVIILKDSNNTSQETSDAAPSYKIEISTEGYSNASYDRNYDRNYEQDIDAFDEKTQKENAPDYSHNPTIIPKISKPEKDIEFNDTSSDVVPKRALEPPSGDD